MASRGCDYYGNGDLSLSTGTTIFFLSLASVKGGLQAMISKIVPRATPAVYDKLSINVIAARIAEPIC